MEGILNKEFGNLETPSRARAWASDPNPDIPSKLASIWGFEEIEAPTQIVGDKRKRLFGISPFPYQKEIYRMVYL